MTSDKKYSENNGENKDCFQYRGKKLFYIIGVLLYCITERGKSNFEINEGKV
jgi:hypothetical protein